MVAPLALTLFRKINNSNNNNNNKNKAITIGLNITNSSQFLLLAYISQRDTQVIRRWYLFIRFFIISCDGSKQVNLKSFIRK